MVEKSLTTRPHNAPDGTRGLHDDHLAVAGREEPAGAGAPAPGAARHLSGAGAHSRARPSVHAADAADRDRRLLARPPAARRSAGARTGGRKRRAGGLDLAAEPRASRRLAGEL